MFCAFVYTLLTLQPFLQPLSAAVASGDREKSVWFMGCVHGSSGLIAPEEARDLDPVTCCVRCLDKGYQVAALTTDGCYCSNWQHGFTASECLNRSYSGETEDIRGDRERQSVLSLPVGGEAGSVALYRTEGPYLHSVRLSASPDRVQAGKTFVVEVSGKLAGRPNQPTGIPGMGGQDLSYVTVEFHERTPKGQSSQQVRVLDDCSFSWTSDWVFETPGKNELNIRVSNPLSTLSSSVHLFVFQPTTHSLVISVLHGPLGVPSCMPCLQTDSTTVTVEAAYLGDPLTLQAHVGDGLTEEFIWCFGHKEKDKHLEGLKTACLPHSDCVNSTVNWTFETEGVHVVSVNASSAYGWTQDTIQVVVVRPAVSDIIVSGSENQLTPEEGVSVDVELLTTMKHLLILNPTLSPEYSDIYAKDNFRNTDRVQIYAAKQAYPTNADITLLAVAHVPDPVELLWLFGDSKSVTTTSRTVTKRYQRPGRYDVVVVMSSSGTSVTSDVFPLVVQRAVKLNRLLHSASVLQNQTVRVSCRVNAGTDVNFLWSFGDGSSRVGQSTEQHVFSRTGEFTVKVTVSNLISSASLSSHIFVVDRPCQPPPVKNMGPLKLQVRRSEVVRLGVTYEAEVNCDISGGLQYTWALFDSAGRVFPLSLIDTHRQSLILPSHLLHYDTYTAVARVQVVGSVVYSNYSVRVEVIPSPPVAFIQGGTNLFINKRNTSIVALEGQSSYDPDFPMNPVSFTWTCKPVSSITSSCFQKDVHTSSPVLVFPANLLKPNFDQFKFTLTIHSGERSASSETFLTLTLNKIEKFSVYCPQCQRDQLNWDQSISVSALCEGCDISPKSIQYSWSLYSVNASSKPVLEVPFCYTVDLSAPSNILEGSAAPPQTPGMSTLHPPVTYAVSASESRAEKPNLNRTDGAAMPETNRKKSAGAGLAETEPVSSVVELRTAGSGEEPFYHPQGEFDPPQPFYSSTEYQTLALDNSSVLYSDHFDRSDVISEFPVESESSADWEFSFPVLESGDLKDKLDSDYDVALMSPEEGDPGISAGRPTGLDGETFSLGDDSVFDPALHEDNGSNLVDDRPSVAVQDPTLLDLPRDPVDRGLFESYTYTGISSPLLSFRPFSLRPGSRYMLEVIAKSHDSFLGRTQLFLKTNPAPKDMTCQVQPITGMELYTHFSIFCTSGKEDLLYEYSMSVGDRPPRMLYQGRDFEYYFSLPSGDPNDDYKVNIYTVIRSSTHGTATKPCPVTVRVQPSFFRGSSSSSHLDPDLELSEAGLRNLSALVQLGNSVDIRNYVSLLSSILNRLSLDAETNSQAQIRTRNVLILTLCELESSEQESVVDNICILKNLLQVTNQVSLASARRVTVHLQVLSERLSQSSAPGRYQLDQKTLNTLVALLSYSLQAGLCLMDIEQASESDTHDENIRNVPSNGCIPDSSNGVYREKLGSISTKQKMQLVDDILQTASDLMLKYILFHGALERRVSTDLIVLYARYQNQTSTVISGSSCTFYLPSSLIQLLFVQRSRDTERACVLSMLTELTHSPYTWAHHPRRLSGPVVGLSLYKCSTRRKIPVHSFIQPITVKLQPPQQKNRSEHQYILLRRQINYHSFNITQEHLNQAIQLSVVFTRPLDKPFPIMLLFRMFERPTPSTHHLHRINHWESNTTRLTLPQSYLSAAGVGHLALLNADFGKATRHKHLSEQVSYSLTVDSRLCLSWDGHQGAWTQHGCRTQHADISTTVNCSCHQLKPLTVVQQQIQSSHDTAGLDPFLSVSSDLTVLGVLVLCVCLYIPGLVVCRRADVISEGNRRVHFLSDNSPGDPYLYAVTIHTGPCSASHMSAKVYIVLHGEDGFSQTKELQVPGCTLFRRNSQDTFIISAAESLGPVWGVHIWQDNSGPSPNWYLKHVEVSEINRGQVRGRAWLFVGQCWLAVNKGDGRVERMLRICTQGISFAKILCFKLSDYLADYHIWISVHSCPCPSLFTRTQRFSVSLLLLLGYASVNAVMITQIGDQVLFEVGIIDVTTVSVTTGVLSVMAALPSAAIISFLFRLREFNPEGSEVKHANGSHPEKDCFEDARSVSDSISEPHLFWSSLQQWAQETWRNKYQGTDLESVFNMLMENKNTIKGPEVQTDLTIRKKHALVVEHNMGPVLLHSSLISEGHKVDQAPQGTEFDLLRESSGFQGSQKTLLSCTRNGGQSIHKDKDPQGKKEEGSHYQAAWSSHSSCCDVIDRPKWGGLRPLSQWCYYLAWTLCLLLSLSCLVLSAVLGMRFSSSQVLLWMHSLFFSLMFCIFLIQPALISAVAVAVSFWYKKRTDFHSFSRMGTSEKEVSKKRSHDGANHHEKQYWKTTFLQERCSNFEKLLGARQRARYLRHVRPPTRAELRKTRGRKRRETLIRKTLRDLSVGGSMFFLMLCINHGSFTDHNHLNQAVRKQFIRGHENAFMSVQKHEDWWKWAQTGLLNSLYKNTSASAESRTLIGEPILWKTESCSFQDKVVVPECLYSFLSGSKTSTHPSSNVLVRNATTPRTCVSATVGLSHRKSDAESKLKLLHSRGWLSRHTAAVKVQFTLFSPAPTLFTSVTMLAEQSPTGVLMPSARVQSARVYRAPAVWDKVVMVCQLIFLFLSLLQLCDQVCSMGQQGLMGYWRTPCNWLEVSLLIVTLVYYVYYIYHSVIILDVVELLQTHNYRGNVDISLLAAWEQYTRTLGGVLLFLLTMKCVTVLMLIRTSATSAMLLTRSFSRLFWPTVSGLVLMVALSCVGNLLFVQSSGAFGSLVHSPQTLLCHHCGQRAVRGLLLLSGHDLLHRGVFRLSSTVWTAVAIIVMSSLVRGAKASQSTNNIFSVAELADYIRQRVSEFTGLAHGHAWSEKQAEQRTYHLEEFESLVDELLFKLDVLTDSLHHTLPPKAHCYREESPVTSPTQGPSKMDAHDFVRETQQLLQQRSQRGDNSSSHIVAEAVYLQHCETRAAENQIDAELSAYLKAQTCRPFPESASLIRVCTENTLEKQCDQRTKTNSLCWSGATQATHAEVVVEVLVHEEPGSIAPHTQKGLHAGTVVAETRQANKKNMSERSDFI